MIGRTVCSARLICSIHQNDRNDDEADYSPPCGKVSLATWSAKNISCSKTIRHVNYVKNDGYYYHAWVSKGATSTATRCYIGANETSFQVNGDGGLTGYGI